MDSGRTRHSWMICEDAYASKSTFLPRTGLILLQLAAEKSRGRTVRMFLLAFQPALRFDAATVFEGLGNWKAIYYIRFAAWFQQRWASRARTTAASIWASSLLSTAAVLASTNAIFCLRQTHNPTSHSLAQQHGFIGCCHGSDQLSEPGSTSKFHGFFLLLTSRYIPFMNVVGIKDVHTCFFQFVATYNFPHSHMPDSSCSDYILQTQWSRNSLMHSSLSMLVPWSTAISTSPKSWSNSSGLGGGLVGTAPWSTHTMTSMSLDQYGINGNHRYFQGWRFGSEDFWPSHRQRIHVPRSTSRLQNQQLPPRGGRSIWANTSSTKLQPVAGDPIILWKRLLIQTDGRNFELKKWVYIDILQNSCKSKFHSQGGSGK